MKIKESNVTVNVKDLNTSVAFYQSIGMTLKNRWGDFYAQLTAPGVVLGLHPTTSEHLPGNSGNTSIGFTVDDLEEARVELGKASIPAAGREEEGGQFLHFKDPDGTALYFIKPKW
jgi:catechol 2,3-dioxygenase-like lactoylglutathione lyase family enzyme